KESNAIGIQLQNLIDGVCEGRRHLIWQPVDQIHVDAVESQFASHRDDLVRHLIRLDAVNGLLHLGLKVLNTHAQAVEAQLAQRLKVRARRYARVDLDPNLGVRAKGEAFPRESKQIFDLRRRKVGRRSATPVKLGDCALPRNRTADALNLALQHAQ